jgi:MSHA biogenesis protein MshQ
MTQYLKLFQTFLVTTLSFLVSFGLYATCSPYSGLASINEISKIQQTSASSADFVELRLMDTDINDVIYDNWNLTICDPVFACNTLSVANFVLTTPYLTRNNYDNFLERRFFRRPFDLLLTDENGYTIDYLSGNGASYQTAACTTPYDGDAITDSLTRRIRRLPDGTGDWDTPPGNSQPPTEGDNNTPPPPGAATLSVTDDVVVQGNNINFEFTLSNGNFNVDITYSMFDGTATDGQDYTSASGTLSIPAGTTYAAISVPTFVTTATEAENFYLLIEEVVNADAPDSIAVGTITPLITARSDLHIDEFNYSSVLDEIIDSSGNDYHATSGSSMATVSGKVCQAFDFTPNGTTDYAVLDHTSLNGLTDFTFSTWIQTSATSAQQEILQGLGGSPNDDEVEIALTNDDNIFIKIRDVSQNFALSTNELTDGNWHHIAFTRSSNVICLYIDGLFKGCNGGYPTGALSIQANSLIVGQEQDSFGGGFDTAQDFEGLIDEILIFDSAFIPSQVKDIYTNQNAGNDWDGTSRICPQLPATAEWRFDEYTYTGAAGEIIDSSLNGYHGESGGAMTNVNGVLCNAIDFSADGSSDYAVLDHNSIDGLNDLTFSIWINTSHTTGFQNILQGMHPGGWDDEFDIYLTDDDTLSFRLLQATGNWPLTVNQMTDGAWHHIAFTRSNDRVCLYTDGTLEFCFVGYPTGAISIEPGALILGQEQDSFGGGFDPAQDFQGYMDEPLLFNAAKSAAEIQTIYNNQNAGINWDGTTRTCPAPPVNHYRIEYDGTGLTCEAEPITFKACTQSAAADPTCANLSTNATSATISAPGTGWVGGTALNWTGSITRSLAVNTASTVTLGLSGTNPTASVVCYQGGAIDASCNFDFADTGFIFTNDTDGNTTIPTQISAKPSNTGFNAKTLAIQAVRTDTNTGTCSGLFANATDVDIDLAYQCTSPATCTANTLNLTNNSNTYNLSVNPTFTTHALRFGADSKASIVLDYPDTGQLQIQAQKSINLGAGVTENVVGNSNNFVVRPFGLKIDTSSDANAANASAIDETGTVFKKAGESFSINATAVGWVSGEDANNDGVPDNLLALNNNPTALNFSSETLNVTHTAQHPAAPAAGTLTGSTNTQTFSASVASISNLAWSEVGVLTLDAQLVDNDYLGTGDVLGQLNNIGRFVPDHFTLVNASAIPACAAASPFTFMNEPFSVNIDIEARNSANAVTSNYRAGHDKATLSFVAENANDGTELTTRLTVAAPTWANGAISTNLASQFARLSPYAVDGPYDAMSIGLKVADNEASTVIALSNALDMNAATNTVCSGAGCDALELESGLSFRLGRVMIKNAYGPSTQQMLVPITTEYWDGANWQTVDMDSCSTIAATSFTLSDTAVTDFSTSIDLKDVNAPATTVGTSDIISGSINELQATNGLFDMVLDIPTYTSGDSGVIKIELDVSAYPWLTFDWNNDGIADGVSPTIYATFGQFRGNDRIIYWREKR